VTLVMKPFQGLLSALKTLQALRAETAWLDAVRPPLARA
jgi:hypothetical protein